MKIMLIKCKIITLKCKILDCHSTFMWIYDIKTGSYIFNNANIYKMQHNYICWHIIHLFQYAFQYVYTCDIINMLRCHVSIYFCLFVFSFLSRIFHSYGDVTITGEELQILTYVRHAWPCIEQWGFFSVPYLLWHGTSVYNGCLQGPMTLTPIA